VPPHAHLRAYLWLVAILVLVAVVAAVLNVTLFGAAPRQISAQESSSPVPPLTPAEQAQLAASHGFQYLVSYTDGGFEPSTLTIKKGETVRFTNNSDEDLWVAATGASGTIYPAGSGNECGQSAFDSCVVLHHGDFWEFTFTQAGTWSYQNNRDTKMTGTIIVK
jgi:plastocyanin